MEELESSKDDLEATFPAATHDYSGPFMEFPHEEAKSVVNPQDVMKPLLQETMSGNASTIAKFVLTISIRGNSRGSA